MLYPIYMQKDAGSAYAVSFPDFPGCFAGADDLCDLPQAVQDAVKAHFLGEIAPIPAPWSFNSQSSSHMTFQDGVWMLMDIDVTEL